eukprot:TRINITY_DN1319_c0_g2_i1.p1 TRINITY_DN1319_c0_g2~~TRINITY_DN1319_c0_g2_i1.p1  ORF type:complete len:759 (+),score=80.96 TRINITY_DN1319_c0_g2_i1:51-2327(+)
MHLFCCLCATFLLNLLENCVARRVRIRVEDVAKTLSCVDFCTKCPGARSIFIRRTAVGEQCALDFIFAHNGEQHARQKQHLLTTSGWFANVTGLHKLIIHDTLHKLSLPMRNNKPLQACSKLNSNHALAEDVAACAAHSLLCGEGNVNFVISNFGKASAVNEAKCSQLSGEADMPHDISHYIDKEHEDHSIQIPKAVAPVRNARLRDCNKQSLRRNRRDPVAGCTQVEFCVWQNESCMTLCDHPDVRDTELACKSQSRCMWNTEKHNRYTGEKGMCQYTCADGPCPSEETSEMSMSFHSLSRSQKDGENFGGFSDEQASQRCYNMDLVKEQMEYDFARDDAPAARICDYAHSQGWLHQFFKHDSSTNCHELPRIDLRNPNIAHKLEYLQAGCWPFVRAASTVHNIQKSIGIAQNGGKGYNAEAAFLSKAIDQEDILQRLAKYSFDPFLDDLGGGNESHETNLKEAGMGANRRLFTQLLCYIARQISKTLKVPFVPKQPFLQMAEAVESPELVHDTFLQAALHTKGLSEDRAYLIAKFAFKSASTILKQIIAGKTFARKTALRKDLQCISALWGRSGFVTGGVRNDGNYIMARSGDQRSNRLICEIDPKNVGPPQRFGPFPLPQHATCTESCETQATVSAMCSRIASAHLNFWAVKQYSEKKGFINKFRLSVSMCLDRRNAQEQSANCWLYQDCMKKVISEFVCRTHPSCCAGALAKWYSIPEGADRIELLPQDWHVADTPRTRLAQLCSRFPWAAECV